MIKVFEMIMAADIDTRSEYFKHIVLSGGSSMYPGLPSRLEKGIRDRYLKDVLKGNVDRLKKFKLKIEDPPRRCVWGVCGCVCVCDRESGCACLYLLCSFCSSSVQFSFSLLTHLLISLTKFFLYYFSPCLFR